MRFLFSIILLLMISSSVLSAEVYIIKTTDRDKGIKALFDTALVPNLYGKKIIIKPNYNSNDPFPAATHIDTLKTIIPILKAATPESITIVERSGMGTTQDVLENKGVMLLAEEQTIEVVVTDVLGSDAWTRRGTKETHWEDGFMVPKIVLEADYVVNLPCLKTHRFGGDFSLALKNHVGTVAKWHEGYNYMAELHSSPNQRKMIAEINKYVPSDLIILDAIKGFSTEGPDKGKLIEPEIMLLSTDPVAIDAVGVAILRMYGTTAKVARGKIFDQDQLKRAAELKIGVTSPQQIKLIAVNKEAEPIIKKIEKILYK
ncbi:MAG: DUF362 domain-containing protein [Candidatus Margulisiibacteriota bacterium]